MTLIELLVIIAVIALLVALLVPLPSRPKQNPLSRTRAELAQIQAAIETYKTVTGSYPPDNPANPLINPLFYELHGTTHDTTKGVFLTLDGSTSIAEAALPATFGVSGLVNCAKAGRAEDAPAARNFLPSLEPNRTATVVFNGNRVKLLVGSVGWPASASAPPLAGHSKVNPFRYVSSNPSHNPQSFDLWIDIRVGSNTCRLSNWSKAPETL